MSGKPCNLQDFNLHGGGIPGKQGRLEGCYTLSADWKTCNEWNECHMVLDELHGRAEKHLH